MLVAVIAGSMVGLGLFVAAVAVAGPPPLRTSRRRLEVRSWLSDRIALRACLAAASVVGVWAATGWPAGGLIAGMGVAAGPNLVGGKARREAAVAKIEAIAGWAEQLRDVMAAADGIQSAILTTAPLAPEPIRGEVVRLADRLARQERLSIALHQFAEEVAHPLTDMVVTSLLIASERQGRLADLLGEVAGSARATATMQRQVESARARSYVTARLIIGVTVGIAAWLVVAARDYLAPFDTAAGQAMLVVIVAVFAVSGVAMQRMARADEPARLLAGVEPEAAWR